MIRLLITAGPTREPIDAVRFIGNRSSGKLGLAIAHAAAADDRFKTTLLLGPGVHIMEPSHTSDRLPLNTFRFESTDDLADLLDQHFPACDVLVMAAAVADYRPIRTIEGKLSRSRGPLTLKLTPTPDLTAQCAARRHPRQRIIAFALEPSDQLESRAIEKLMRKNVDAIIANPLKTMGADEIEPLWITRNGSRETPGRLNKHDFATWLLNRICSMSLNINHENK